MSFDGVIDSDMQHFVEFHSDIVTMLSDDQKSTEIYELGIFLTVNS